jgi:epoxyqueuosine reductase
MPDERLARYALADWAWITKEDFAGLFRDSAVLRIGWTRFLRNVAVALGNGPGNAQSRAALQHLLAHPDSVVREHAAWGMERQV